jgi:hypothetical protein
MAASNEAPCATSLQGQRTKAAPIVKVRGAFAPPLPRLPLGTVHGGRRWSD